MVTNRSVFSESPAPTFYKWSIELFLYLAPFSRFGIFVYNGILLSWGNFTPFFGPPNYEYAVQKPQKGTCTNGIEPFRCEKFTLASALQPVDDFEKKKITMTMTATIKA